MCSKLLSDTAMLSLIYDEHEATDVELLCSIIDELGVLTGDDFILEDVGEVTPTDLYCAVKQLESQNGNPVKALSIASRLYDMVQQ